MKIEKLEQRRIRRAQEIEDVLASVKRPMEPGEPKLKLTFRRALRMGFHTYRQLDDPYYAGFAAQIAYFFFMSIVPTMVILTQVFGIFDISLEMITDWLKKNMGRHMSTFVENLFSASNVETTNLLMGLIALWSASSLIFSLSRLFSYTLSNGRYRFNFFKERFRSIPLALFSTIVIASALILLVYGELIFTNLFKDSKVVAYVLKISWIGYLFLFFVLIFVIYLIVPKFRVPARSMMPGTIFASLGVFLATEIYSIYIDYSVNYDILYGSFANIIALLLWFYIIAWILGIGMMFNKSWDIYMARGRLGPKKIKSYIIDSLDGDESKLSRLYFPEGAHFDRTIDTLAVNMSRIFVDGYNEVRDTFPDKYDGAPDRERQS